MRESRDSQRAQVVWWVLVAMVTIAGLAVPGRLLPVTMAVVVSAAFARSMARAARVLPERVASHFGFSLQADGWMARRWYLLLVSSLMVVVGGFVPLGMFLAARRVGDAKIERLALWLVPMIVSMFLGLNELTVNANQREPAELSQWIWALLGVFLVTINLWGLGTALLPW